MTSSTARAAQERGRPTPEQRRHMDAEVDGQLTLEIEVPAPRAKGADDVR